MNEKMTKGKMFRGEATPAFSDGMPRAAADHLEDLNSLDGLLLLFLLEL